MTTINLRHRAISTALLLGFLLSTIRPASAHPDRVERNLRTPSAKQGSQLSGLEETLRAGGAASAPGLRPIGDIVHSLGIQAAEFEPYGRDIAKIRAQEVLARLKEREAGKLVIVTGITPTPAGEGKTTTSIGLLDGLSALGVPAVAALREPSLGPVFGAKGGATGTGRAQLHPGRRINLAFTGDFTAVADAHNLLVESMYNAIYWGKQPKEIADRPAINYVVDLNARSLREIKIKIGKEALERDQAFILTPASEVMAILALSRDEQDLRERLARIIIAWRPDGTAVRAADLGSEIIDNMVALLAYAQMPNLVQTLEGNPVLVHAGPFANIAHGTSSVIATHLGQKLVGPDGVVIQETGFGSDMGFTKCCEVVCPEAGLVPDLAVVVVSARALRWHGGVSEKELAKPNVEAVRRGLANPDAHLRIVGAYGVPAVVAINRFESDSDEELAAIRDHLAQQGVPAAIFDGVARGGEGGSELARVVVETLRSRPSAYKPRYQPGSSTKEKLAVAAETYGADGVDFSEQALQDIQRMEGAGFGGLPVVVVKTPASLSDDPKKLGVPTGWRLHVQGVQVSAGAGFLRAYVGKTPPLLMPGLPKQIRVLPPDGHRAGLEETTLHPVEAGLEPPDKPLPQKEDKSGWKHPFLTAMDTRQDRVKELAAQLAVKATARGQPLPPSLTLSPEEVEALRNPMHEVYNVDIVWKLDNGREVTVRVIVVRDTGNKDIPSKGGVRSIRFEPNINGPAVKAIWNAMKNAGLLPSELGWEVDRLSEEVARALSKGMSWKIALVGLHHEIGGGKAEIQMVAVDEDGRIVPLVQEPSEGELARLYREVGRQLAKDGIVGPGSYSLAGDVNTGPREVAWMAEGALQEWVDDWNHPAWKGVPEGLVENWRVLAQSEAAGGTEPILLREISAAVKKGQGVPGMAYFTGKHPDLGGSDGRSDANGWAVRYLAEELLRLFESELKDPQWPLEGLRLVMHGFGAVAEPTARLLTAGGGLVMAVSDHPDTYLEKKDEKGGVPFTLRDLDAMWKYRQEVKRAIGSEADALELRKRGVAGVYSLRDDRVMLEKNVDMLVLGAVELAVTEENAPRIQARYVLCAANGGVTPEGADILAEKEIIYLPDTLISSGGVIVSRDEMLQNERGERWEEGRVLDRLKERLTASLRELLRFQEELAEALGQPVSLQTAADFLAIRRLAEEHLRRPPAPSRAAAGLEEAADEEMREVVEAVERMAGLPERDQAQALVDLFHRRIGAWGGRPEMTAAFDRLPDGARNRFTLEVDGLLERLAGRTDLIVELSETAYRAAGSPFTVPKPGILTGGEDHPVDEDDYRPVLLSYSTNPTWDREVRLVTLPDGRRILSISGRMGGFPANLVRATAAGGGRARLIAMLPDDGMDRQRRAKIAESLGWSGVDLSILSRRGVMRVTLVVVPSEGDEFRLTTPGEPLDGDSMSWAEQAVEQSIGWGAPMTLAIGEQVPGQSVAAQVGLIRRARRLNPKFRVYAKARPSWSPAMWEAMLAGVRPDIFSVDVQSLGRYLGVDPASTEWTPERIADEVDKIRWHSNGLAARGVGGKNRLEEMAVWLGPARELLVTDGSRWVVKAPEPLRHRTGGSDVGLAYYRLAREGDFQQNPLEAAKRSVRAQTVFLSRRDEGPARIPSMRDVLHAPEPVVTELPRAGLEEAGIAELEQKIALRFRALLEAPRAGRGLLVVPEETLRQFDLLEEFLARVPAEIAQSIVLWGAGPEVEGLAKANSNLQVVRYSGEPGSEDAVVPLANELARLTWDRGATRIGILGGPVPEGLSALLRQDGVNIVPGEVALTLRDLLQMLGVVTEAEGVELEGLLEDLGILRNL
ncbi:MAG: formate--tetrahydrofolate ligase [Candidatus Omnitrophica bacterium]|nr:formate--tetrahydrofolate ligase [Candidatus Omnitrophota bacterium]